jgi:hypothetical protein
MSGRRHPVHVLLLIMGAISAALIIALAAGVVTPPGAPDGTPAAQASTRASAAARRAAANAQWASGVCMTILDWKNELHRDESSLDLGFGPVARVQDAVAATSRLLNRLHRLGLPPGAQTPAARAQTAQLVAEIQTRVTTLQRVADQVAGGNLSALGTLVGDLQNDTALPNTLAGEVHHLVSVDLGVSLVETRACRQLVGIPV